MIFAARTSVHTVSWLVWRKLVLAEQGFRGPRAHALLGMGMSLTFLSGDLKFAVCTYALLAQIKNERRLRGNSTEEYAAGFPVPKRKKWIMPYLLQT